MLSLFIKHQLKHSLCRQTSRSLSTKVGDFSSVHVTTHNEMPSLIASRSIQSDEEIFQFTGKLLSENTGDRCLQVSLKHWITPDPTESEPPWVYLNHSFNPSVHVSHEKVLPPFDTPPIITATANHDISIDTPLTIDYTLHEWEMYEDGFECSESGRQVKGFKHLSILEKKDVLMRCSYHIQILHKMDSMENMK